MNHSMVIGAILFIPIVSLMLDLACVLLPTCKIGTHLMNEHPEGGFCGRHEICKANTLIGSTASSNWLQGSPRSPVPSVFGGPTLT